MRKIKFLYLLAAIGGLLNFTSCSDDDNNGGNPTPAENLATIGFEDIVLPDTGFVNNLEYQSEGVRFSNNYSESAYGPYWDGFSFSKLTDRTTAGIVNQYSTYAESGAEKSKNFAIAFAGFESPTNFQFVSDQTYTLKSVMLNNSTYTALSIKDGDSFSKQFEADDWFKVIFTGYNVDGTVGKTVEFYLADYRDNKEYICNEWTKADLESLGKVNKVTITFDSTDKGEFGVNTPQYVCLDNLVYVKE